MDEETESTEFASVGERLRTAREEQGLSLEDIAAETRIPLRHLESLESSDWDKLPAPTYTVGFAKSYAGALGLDRAEIGEQLKDEMGGIRNETSTVEYFEPADPARSMPRWLVLAAIVAIVVVVGLFSWLRNQELAEDDVPVATAAQERGAAGPAGAPPAAVRPQQQAIAQGPVLLTATEPAWIQVRDQGSVLFEGLLDPGETYQVPPNATAPILKAGKPEALRITVGGQPAPPVGPAGQVASNVSLSPADLMRGPAGEAGQPQQQGGTPSQNSLAQ